jgi:hypothetical protein
MGRLRRALNWTLSPGGSGEFSPIKKYSDKEQAAMRTNELLAEQNRLLAEQNRLAAEAARSKNRRKGNS